MKIFKIRIAILANLVMLIINQLTMINQQSQQLLLKLIREKGEINIEQSCDHECLLENNSKKKEIFILLPSNIFFIIDTSIGVLLY